MLRKQERGTRFALSSTLCTLCHNLQVRRNALDFDMAADEDFWFVIKMIMKCADISHCGVDWSQHFQWCQRLSVEFYDQV